MKKRKSKVKQGMKNTLYDMAIKAAVIVTAAVLIGLVYTAIRGVVKKNAQAQAIIAPQAFVLIKGEING
jgi:hypothetical protein